MAAVRKPDFRGISTFLVLLGMELISYLIQTKAKNSFLDNANIERENREKK